MAKVQIEIKVPDVNTPGFLRRAKQATTFAEQLKGESVSPELFDAMVEFLLPFVTLPVDRAKAREALWDASQKQFEQVMTSLMGGGKRSEVPPPSTPA